MNKIMQFLQEDNGTFSGQRLGFVLWNICLCAVWTYVSFKQGQLAAIEPGVLAGMGIMQAGKVGQKLVEGKSAS
jgi:hypothetical protein